MARAGGQQIQARIQIRERLQPESKSMFLTDALTLEIAQFQSVRAFDHVKVFFLEEGFLQFFLMFLSRCIVW